MTTKKTPKKTPKTADTDAQIYAKALKQAAEAEAKGDTEARHAAIDAAVAAADRMEAQAVRVLSKLGLTADPKMTARRQVNKFFMDALRADFVREFGEEQLQPGELVRLKSGGPVMTIEAIEKCDEHGDIAICVWFVFGDAHSGSFSVDALVKAPVAPSLPN